MNNSRRIAEFIQTKFHDERPEFIISVGGVSQEADDDGKIRHTLALTDKDRMYKVTVEAL